MTKLIHVAAAVIPDGDGNVLLARRLKNAHQGGKLEFPGGKVEAGEAVEAALIRELKEELDIEVRVAEPLIKIRHDYPDKSILLDVWKVNHFEGEPVGMEGQAIFWRALNELDPNDFPDANVPIISAAQLPRKLAISSPDPSMELPKAELLIARWPQFSEEDFQKLLEGCRESDVQRLSIHTHVDMAVHNNTGLHLPSRMLFTLSERPSKLNGWFSASVHNLEEIHAAERLGVDFVVLGSVKKTTSHTGQSGIGWAAFSELVSQSKVPVYALGGMQEADLDKAISCGAQGIAGISMFQL